MAKRKVDTTDYKARYLDLLSHYEQIRDLANQQSVCGTALFEYINDTLKGGEYAEKEDCQKGHTKEESSES